jgi:FKBP-type peptidyl-prolyl cis-trans isomerase
MNKVCISMGIVFFLLAFVGTPLAGSFAALPSGLEYKDLKVGSGPAAQLGSTVVIHFTGWVDKNSQRGKEIYNSRKEREPVSFVIGTDKVIQGWNEGAIGMQAGGTRMLRIPPALGYGAKAVEDVIPPNAHLLFIIELLEVN